MKNILFVPGFVCDTWSPIENYTLELTCYLQKKCNIYWLAPSIHSKSNKYKNSISKSTLKEPVYISKAREKCVQIIIKDLSKFNVFKNYFILHKILKEHKIDAVYVQFGFERYVVPLIAKILGKKVIYHEHGYPPALKHPRIRRIFYTYLVDSFLTISNFVAQELPNKKPIKVVHNSIQVIPESKILTAKAKAKNLKLELLSDHWEYIVVMVAAFRDMKRHDLAVEIVNKVKMLSSKKVRFVFLGQGQLYDSVNALVNNLGLSNDIVMPGHVNNVDDYLAAADISMLTSTAEPFGVSLLESMNYMLPTMSFASASAKEIITDNVDGILVPLLDIEEYARKIILLLNDQNKRDRLGKNAIEKINFQFGHDAWKEKIGKAFMELV